MEPENQLPQLPPEIQRLEAARNAAKSAFDLPDLQLPSYDQIGKSKDSVFQRDGGKLVPRKPTFQEEMEESARRMQAVPNQLDPISEYSRKESEGFNNPMLPYDPMVDMNEVYAKYDPVTWGDVAEKTWDTTVNNMWSGTKNIWNGLKEGITEGRVSALWDNEYSQHLAEITENMERMKPLRFSKEEQGTTEAWLKQVFPSLGYVASSVVEMAAQHAAFTVAGGIIGAVAGEGIGAVPGAVAGNMAALVKDAQTMGNALANINRTARVINTLSTGNKIKKGAQLIGYGLLSANGEAALNSQMAYNRALEEQKSAYFQENGRYLTGDELRQAEANAKSTGDVTMALNLPLIAATNLFEFGNLVRGKAIPQVASKLAFRVNKKGVAEATNTWLKIGGRYAQETASEGFEEFAQGLIEDSSVNYFTQKLDNRKNYLETFTQAAFNRATSGEGASDFFAGALIGGMSNAADLTAYSKVKSNTQRFVSEYNNSVQQYFDGLGSALRTDESLKVAMRNADGDAAKNILRGSVADLVNRHAKSGSTQAFAETLDAMSDMENSEFRKVFGMALDENEQALLLTQLTEEYKVAAKMRNRVDSAFQVNPFEAESWFQQKINKSKSDFKVDKDKAAEVWDVFKDTLTSNMVKHGNIDRERQIIEAQGSALTPEFLSLTGASIPSLVENKKASLRSRVAAKLPGYESDQAVLELMEAQPDSNAAYRVMMRDAEKRSPGVTDIVLEHNRHLQQEQILIQNNQRLNTKAGQRREIKKIIDWQNWYEGKITEIIPPVAPVTEIVSPPTVTDTSSASTTVGATAPVVEDAVAPTVVDPLSPVTTPSAITDPVITDEVLVEESPIADEITNEEITDDLDALYGEGKGEDYIADTLVQQPEATPKTPPKKVVQPIDPELPEDIQIDETVIPEAVNSLEEGETIVPEESGVEVSLDGEVIEEITKEKGKVKGKKKSGEIVEIPNNSIPLLRTEKADSSPVTDVATFAQANNLNIEQITMLKSLVENKIAEIKCG